jgi:hypothetical protein
MTRIKPSSPPNENATPVETTTASWRGWLVQAISTWLFSVMITLGVPSLPLAIEAAKHVGKVQPESYYLTAAVLSASFGIASDHHLFRCGYISDFSWNNCFRLPTRKRADMGG